MYGFRHEAVYERSAKGLYRAVMSMRYAAGGLLVMAVLAAVVGFNHPVAAGYSTLAKVFSAACLIGALAALICAHGADRSRREGQ